MFPYETNATFVRGTCKRHSKYYFLPFGALRKKKSGSGCGKQVLGGAEVGGCFSTASELRNSLFLSKRMLAGFILGVAFLPCWGLEIAL